MRASLRSLSRKWSRERPGHALRRLRHSLGRPPWWRVNHARGWMRQEKKQKVGKRGRCSRVTEGQRAVGERPETAGRLRVDRCPSSPSGGYRERTQMVLVAAVAAADLPLQRYSQVRQQDLAVRTQQAKRLSLLPRTNAEVVTRTHIGRAAAAPVVVAGVAGLAGTVAEKWLREAQRLAAR